MRDAAFFMSGQSSTTPSGALRWLLHAMRAAYRAGVKRRELMRLTEIDDHLLDDMGVTREDVRWAIDLPFSYDPGIELQRRAWRNSRRGWRG